MPLHSLSDSEAREPRREKEDSRDSIWRRPIGAAIVRLMREKQSIEVIGAIDTDPAKAGRDLGEVLGAAGCALGSACIG